MHNDYSLAGGAGLLLKLVVKTCCFNFPAFCTKRKNEILNCPDLIFFAIITQPYTGFLKTLLNDITDNVEKLKLV